jgi:hypothetical protein
MPQTEKDAKSHLLTFRQREQNSPMYVYYWPIK